MNRQLMLGIAAAIVLAIGLPSAVSCQTRPEIPTVSHVESGYYEITLEVQAGAHGAGGGFKLQWMTRADYDRLGGWPADELHPAVHTGEFYGMPSLNPSTGNYQLGPDGTIQVQIGDLFDETGVLADYVDVLDSGTEFLFRVKAVGALDGPESDYTRPMSARTPSTECTRGCTQAFWRRHAEMWPARCVPMLLGNVSYNKAQLLDILRRPARGNGLIALAHQLIAVKLNLCNGSDPVNVIRYVEAADRLIGDRVVPPIGSGRIHSTQTCELTEKLDRFNNGKIRGVVTCPLATEERTWGSLRAQYR